MQQRDQPSSAYTRVLPRDLFNESKLLKCLGQLSLLAHDGHVPLDVTHIYVTDIGKGFDIRQYDHDGSLYCRNLHFYTKKRRRCLLLTASLNSREPYPLLFVRDAWVEDAVFHDDGTLTDEFLTYIKEVEGPDE